MLCSGTALFKLYFGCGMPWRHGLEGRKSGLKRAAERKFLHRHGRLSTLTALSREPGCGAVAGICSSGLDRRCNRG